MVALVLRRGRGMVQRALRKQAVRFRSFALSLGEGRECPICRWSGRHFLPHGIRAMTHRLDARCPSCGSLERHRLVYLVFNRLDPPRPLITLHAAPEPSLREWLRSRSDEYLSIDLEDRAMRRMDLTSLEFGDASHTLVWCSNVLEHIADDARAMREMHRVLRPGGIAVLQVPIWRHDSTYEDPAIVSPEDRLRHFYQKDHVRLYGLADFVRRLEASGFRVDVHRTQDFGTADITRYGLSYICTNEVFVCVKPGG